MLGLIQLEENKNAEEEINKNGYNHQVLITHNTKTIDLVKFIKERNSNNK